MSPERLAEIRRVNEIGGRERWMTYSGNWTHNALRDLLAEVDRLRSAVGAGLDELRDEHRQAADGIGCVTCYPSDGRWPCTSALIADALAAALSGEHPERNDG